MAQWPKRDSDVVDTISRQSQAETFEKRALRSDRRRRRCRHYHHHHHHNHRKLARAPLNQCP